MDLPLSIILDVLSKYKMETHIPDTEKRMYKGISMMPDPPYDLVASLLHVSLLSVVVRAGGLEKGQTCVCLRDRKRDERETHTVLHGLIIIETEYPMEYIFHEIHNVFILLSDWERAMLDCIIHKDFGTLAALGENVIGHRILILDTSLALLAHSSGSTEQLWDKLAEFSSRHDIKALLRTDLSSGPKTGSSVCIVDDFLLSEQAVAVITIEINPVYAVYMIAEGIKRPVKSSLIDLFELFSEYVASFVINRLDSPMEGVCIYQHLISDLIEGKVTDSRIIKSRCEFSGLRDKAPYILLKIQIKQPDQRFLAQALEALSLVLPDAKLLLFKQHILALNYVENKTTLSTGCVDGLTEFLEQYGAVCGVSGLLYDISALRTAYEQTELAVEYGQRVGKNKLLSDMEQEALSIVTMQDIYRFEDYDLYRMLEGGDHQKESMFTSSFCFCALSKLWLNDKISRLNNLKLLYIYLLTERQGTLTARILHMHRNNIYYHITRIEEQLGIDLNDPELRTKLLMSYKIIDLYGVDYLSMSDYYNSLDTDILRELCALNKTKTIKKTLGAL